MWKNHLKIAIRNFTRNKFYSGLNLLGLSVGMAGFLLLLQYTLYELSYDRYHERAETLYRVAAELYKDGAHNLSSATTYLNLGPALKRDFPEVDQYVRFFPTSGQLRIGEEHFREERMYYADGSLFGLFTIPLLQGDAETALQAPNSVVISASVARKYFGTVNCIGKAVELNNWYRQREYTVSGVFLDIPEHSHLKSSLFFSLSTLTQTHGVLSEWGWRDFYTYLLLREGTAEAFQDKIAAEDYLGKQYGRYRELGVRHELFLQPITDIHLTSRLNLEVEPNGNGRSVRYLLLIGLFILLMAWVNYINLTTARAVNRAKEVGIRKAVGAGRGSLLRQFMVESLLMNSLAFGLAAGLTATVQPWFYQLVGKVVPLQVLQRPELLGVTSVMFFLGMVLSSAYPAFVLSAYTPLDALKEKVKEAAGELSLRKALIVFQFTLSVLLAVATVVVYHQLEYMRSQDLGMNISQTLAVQAPTPHDSLALSRYRTFKNRLMQHPEVIGVTGSHLVPGDNYLWTVGIRRLQDGGNGVAHQTAFLNAVEPSFLPDYEMDILAGRNFHPEEGLDQDAMILSETACRQLGFPGYEKALGQQFALVGDTFNVIGVMSDYHQWGLQEATGAYVFIQRPDEFRRYAVKLSGGGTEQSVALVQEIYNDIFEDGVFEYFFLDRHFNEQYRADEQFGQSVSLFAGLALFIACLGLLGLSLFMALQRTKEVGIRKVLGASVLSIIGLLSKDFLKLVALAILIAIPMAWYMMHQWLQDFAYRIELHWWFFALAALAAVLIAFLTVSLQSMKVAMGNPVEALRSE